MSATVDTATDFPAALQGTGFNIDAIDAIADFCEDPQWLRDRRHAALAFVDDGAMPTRRDEHWRFTNLRGISLDDVATFTACDNADAAMDRARTSFTAASDTTSARFVSVNNAVWEATTSIGDLPDGVIVSTLHDAIRDHEDLVRASLGSLVSASASVDDYFVSLNEAASPGGVFVYVPRGVKLELPVEYVLVHAVEGGSIMPRVLVVLEEQAEATFIEEYVSVDGVTSGFSNAIVELIIGANAHLHYVTCQDYATGVDHFATHRLRAERDAQVDWVAVGLGGARGKSRMEVELAGPGAQVRVTGACLLDGTQQIDYDTLQVHAAPNAMSDLSFKGALAGRSHSVWRGMIDVRPGAQGTDSYQENRNLLLSPQAHADSIPGLQIEANEVRCTHAATISKVDPEQLFYLMARGVHREEAVRTVVRGFYAPILDRITHDTLRERISEGIFARLDRVARV